MSKSGEFQMSVNTGEMPGVELKVTASVGGAMVVAGDDADAVLRRADKAMYRAKTSGSGTALAFR